MSRACDEMGCEFESTDEELELCSCGLLKNNNIHASGQLQSSRFLCNPHFFLRILLIAADPWGWKVSEVLIFRTFICLGEATVHIAHSTNSSKICDVLQIALYPKNHHFLKLLQRPQAADRGNCSQLQIQIFNKHVTQVLCPFVLLSSIGWDSNSNRELCSLE